MLLPWENTLGEIWLLFLAHGYTAVVENGSN